MPTNHSRKKHKKLSRLKSLELITVESNLLKVPPKLDASSVFGCLSMDFILTAFSYLSLKDIASLNQVNKNLQEFTNKITLIPGNEKEQSAKTYAQLAQRLTTASKRWHELETDVYDNKIFKQSNLRAVTIPFIFTCIAIASEYSLLNALDVDMSATRSIVGLCSTGLSFFGSASLSLYRRVMIDAEKASLQKEIQDTIAQIPNKNFPPQFICQPESTQDNKKSQSRLRGF